MVVVIMLIVVECSACDVGAVHQSATKPVLCQRSVNVLHVSKPQSTTDIKSADAKPNCKPVSGICHLLYD